MNKSDLVETLLVKGGLERAPCLLTFADGMNTFERRVIIEAMVNKLLTGSRVPENDVVRRMLSHRSPNFKTV